MAPERGVAARQPLGTGDDVRADSRTVGAEYSPEAPDAQITSSETRRTPWRSQISRTRWKYPGGGGKQPPEFLDRLHEDAATVLALSDDGPFDLVFRAEAGPFVAC